MTIIRGYVGFLEVIAFPDSEIPHYVVPRDGFLRHYDEDIKKGTYIGTVKFTEIQEILINHEMI